jgi:hypothetical protein
VAGFLQGMLDNAGAIAAGLMKGPPSLQHPVVMQQLDRQSPAINMRRRTPAKAKDKLPRPPAKSTGFSTVGHNFFKKSLS